MERNQTINWVYDFGWARGDNGLRHFLETLNLNGYELVCLTHVTADGYRVFYRRPKP
jgi:hypothetical protein